MWTQLQNGDGIELEDVRDIRFCPAEDGFPARLVILTVPDRNRATDCSRVHHICRFDGAVEAINYRDTLFAQVAKAKRATIGRSVTPMPAVTDLSGTIRAFNASAEPDWVDGGDMDRGDRT